MTTVDPLQKLVDGWLAYHRATQTDQSGVIRMPASDELFQHVIDVDEIVRSDPELAWGLIQLIFAACRNDLERACLAAGPLEDLLVNHGPVVIERVEAAASSDSLFKELLVGVWRNGMTSSIWTRIQSAAGIE